jgi:hypothetical protein
MINLPSSHNVDARRAERVRSEIARHARTGPDTSHHLFDLAKAERKPVI